jgi:hypothetical protein
MLSIEYVTYCMVDSHGRGPAVANRTPKRFGLSAAVPDVLTLNAEAAE